MGVNFSRTRDLEWNRQSQLTTDAAMERDNESEDEFQEAQEVPLSPAQEMVEFRKLLATKREQRRQIIAKHSEEKENLRKALIAQVQINERIVNENKLLREQLEQRGIDVPETAETQTFNSEGPISVLMVDLDNLKEHNRRLQSDLAETNVALQSANADMANLRGMNIESMKQISALKEVVAVSKTMMQIRESQLIELKARLSQIEASLAEREAGLLSTDLRAEYERQLQNIRALRSLYEERARLAEVTRAHLARQLEEQKLLAAVETSRCKELTDRVAELEVKLAEMSDSIDEKDDQISATKEETRGLKAEMSTVNKLFSQMLLGYRSHQDLDKLVSRLEENHGILAHMVAKDGAEASSALPKLLLDLVGQLDQDKSEDKNKNNYNETSLNTTAEEIVDNLPKVWRVLMELLSHQSAADNNPQELHPSTCYKPVETSSGIRMVPSVSQTYIRLKDLIVEKLSLTKEMNKMKQLNSHLESRLEEQERRLCLVTSELSKTWHVVGKLRRHHHQLHTHEKILRYELQQKRKLLSELKEELEYCKEKWDKAREKNCESEKEWTKLRTELSERQKVFIMTSNNSGESGYSDERQTEDDSTESNDESECIDDVPVRCKKRIKKTIERENPVIGFLNDADLPLEEINPDEKDDDLSTSESCVSDSLFKSLITEESVNDSENQMEESEVNSNNLDEKNTLSMNPIQNISPQVDEMFGKSQKNLVVLEDSCSSLLKQTIKVSELSENIKEKIKILKSKKTSQDLSNEDPVFEKDSSNYKPTGSLSSQSEINENNAIAGSSQMIPNVMVQNERLAECNDKLKNVEENCNPLLKSPENRLQINFELENKLDTIEGLENGSEQHQNEELTNSNASENLLDDKSSTSFSQVETSNNIDLPSSNIFETKSTHKIPSNLIDPKENLKNVMKQDERLALRDERMKKLEEECNSLLKISKNTKEVGCDIEVKLDILLEKSTGSNFKSGHVSMPQSLDDKEIEENEKEEETVSTSELSEKVEITESTSESNDKVEETETNSFYTLDVASTSAASIDHEARFAARDERFKRLEEGAKSLVDKVNDTTTKSVKITYKLEELHNIYGSDNGNLGSQNSEDENGEETDLHDTKSG